MLQVAQNTAAITGCYVMADQDSAINTNVTGKRKQPPALYTRKVANNVLGTRIAQSALQMSSTNNSRLIQKQVRTTEDFDN